MNNLSPKLSDKDFRKRVEWALQRGCDTVHYFLAVAFVAAAAVSSYGPSGLPGMIR